MTQEEVLKKVDDLLEKEGLNKEDLSNDEKLSKYILPSLEQSKSTLSNLYKFQPNSNGTLGKIKEKILSKLKNIVINVVERESMRQQKFNELTYQAIVALVEENKKLKEKLDKKD